jgi:hypothetical protein
MVQFPAETKNYHTKYVTSSQVGAYTVFLAANDEHRAEVQVAPGEERGGRQQDYLPPLRCGGVGPACLLAPLALWALPYDKGYERPKIKTIGAEGEASNHRLVGVNDDTCRLAVPRYVAIPSSELVAVHWHRSQHGLGA